mmetsp:Transcript_18862/g.26763  ORF Transcript_18862/g.26763 Transcript_18862/m.26763 type:complete len:234 (+) Transcript_18862:210-911(+)
MSATRVPFSAASPSVRSMFRENLNESFPILPKSQSLEDEHEMKARVDGQEEDILRTFSGGMMVKPRSASEKLSSWVQKKYLGKLPQLTPIESKATALRLASQHERSEHEGCKRTVTYTVAPSKPRDFRGVPKFTPITPQQAAALYAKNHGTKNAEKVEKKYPLTVRQAMQQKTKQADELCVPADDLPQIALNAFGSRSFEDNCNWSSSEGTEMKHEDYLLLSPMSVRNLPSIC